MRASCFVRLVSLVAAFAVLVACSHAAAPIAAPSCTADFSGNTVDSATLPASCAALSLSEDAGAGAGYVLSLQASSTQIAQLSIAIDLGESPSAGSFSQDTVADWSAVGLSGGSSACAFSAGSDASQKGTFTLTLTSVDVAAGEAHGTLEMTMYVHALAVACPPGDTESVTFAF